jgi:glutathione S-transferase
MAASFVLVGQYDSPFVRRAAVALHHYGITFERSVLSTFADFDAMLELSPLGKVPVLILPGGERLWDSRAILDFLHGKAPLERLLLPREEPERRRVLRLEATALGLAEKAYERGLEFPRRAPGTHDLAMVARLDRQIGSALAWLEARRPVPFFQGLALNVADATAAVALTYIREKLPKLAPHGAYPALEAHRAACELLSSFQAAPYSAAEAAKTGWRPAAAD